MERAEADALFDAALEHQQAGRPGEARPLYERVLSAFPDHPHAPHLLGVIVAGQGDWYYARRLLETARRAQPRDADIAANLALVQQQLGDHVEAVRSCDEALAIEPRHVNAQYLRAVSLRQSGRVGEALAALAALLRTQPAHATAWVQQAGCLEALGRREEALASIDRALALQPRNAAWLDLRGKYLNLMGRHEESVASFTAAIEAQPQLATAHFHLGMALQNVRRFEEALARYDTALQLDPGNAQAWLYRGFALQRLRRIPQDCLASIDRALAIKPDYFEALNGRANVLGQLRRHEEALADYDRIVAMRPDFHEAWLNRGHVLRELGRLDEAEASLRESVARGGDAHLAGFVLAAMGRGEAPSTAPEGYVAKLFDDYADRFDDHLVRQLEYQAHERVCELVRPRIRPPADIVDLGCGTGLCGPMLAPVARSLVGVDLSQRMLQVAAAQGHYTRLDTGEIVAWLDAAPPASADVVVSTDVFIYVGALEATFAGTRKVLRPRGLFAFSVESLEEGDFVLRPTRRYAHSRAYVDRLAQANGFMMEACEPLVLRKEKGQGTPGLAIVLRLA